MFATVRKFVRFGLCKKTVECSVRVPADNWLQSIMFSVVIHGGNLSNSVGTPIGLLCTDVLTLLNS